jgi:linoleoyl-CoA desaturase
MTSVNNPENFTKVLHSRINAYFKTNGISRKMDGRMLFKIIFGAAWWIGSYVLLFIWDLPFWQFLLLYIFQGLSQVFLALAIAHDANHSAISDNPKVNKFFGYAFDVCGVSSYNWRVVHNNGHHYCVNVHGEDIAVTTGGLIRMAPGEPRRKIHQYQHIYFWFLYSLYTIDYVLVRDFKYVFTNPVDASKSLGVTKMQIAGLLLSKIFYLGYMIVIPALFLDFSVWTIIGTFVLTHLIMGLIMLLTFQTSHIVSDTTYPLSRDDYEEFVRHVFATTSDYGLAKRAFTWYVGALNLHVIHHLVPDICHTHYPALTKIIASTADEFNVSYRQNPSLRVALISHHRLLKRLGSHDSLNSSVVFT